MTLPAVNSEYGTSVAPRSLASDTGTAFVLGTANRGRTDKAVLIGSLSEFTSTFGPRVSYSSLYDTLDVAFREGLDHAYVARCVGAAAATATKDLPNASSENTLEVSATSPGEWGNSIKVEVVEGAAEGSFKLRVLYEGDLVEASGELEDNEDAVAWASKSAYIRLVDLGKGDPKAGNVTLASGADDRNNVNTEVLTAGLALFTPDLGAGQVAIPGNTAEAVQEAILAHCLTTQRVPLPDLEDTAEAEDLLAAAAALRSVEGARQGALFTPWDIAPGIAPGTTRTVPPCARQLAAMARVDGETGNPNIAAAGEGRGRARYTIGLSQTFTDSDREALNDAGVNVSIIENGTPTTYGWRSMANSTTEPGWVPLSTARLMMSLASATKAILRRYLFSQLDEQGSVAAAVEGTITNEVIEPAFKDGALYGATLAEACQVTVSQEVSPTDGSVAKLSAAIEARPSKFAEVMNLTVDETNEAL